MPEWSQVASIWIAPLTTLPQVREALVAWPGPKLVLAGDSDKPFEPIERVDTLLLSGADHGLNVGEAAASACALADALDGVRSFLRDRVAA